MSCGCYSGNAAAFVHIYKINKTLKVPCSSFNQRLSKIHFELSNSELLRVKFNLLFLQGDDDAEASKPINDEGMKTLQKQEEMFRNLDVQYEMARSQTHTQRGMGLGFSSSFSRGMDSI